MNGYKRLLGDRPTQKPTEARAGKTKKCRACCSAVARGKRKHWWITTRGERKVVIGLFRPWERPGQPLRQILCEVSEIRGLTEAKAVQHLKQLHAARLAELERETEPPLAESGRTLHDLICAYRAGHLPTLRDQRYYGRILDWWDGECGRIDLAQLDLIKISKSRDQLLSRVAPATVVRHLAVLSSVCSYGVKHLHWLGDNPVSKVARPKIQNQQTRWLSDDERARLLCVCESSDSPDLLDAVLVALATGCRSGELYALRWESVDLKRSTITFANRKNNADLIQTLPAEIAQRLRARKLRSSRVVVFPHNVRRSWTTALRLAQIEKFRWHDLRHSCASYLAQSGFSLVEIAAHLGHESTQSTQRYAHLSAETTRRTSTAVADRIFRGLT